MESHVAGTGRTFLFAGGGSGGHLFPGLAVAEELKVRDTTCQIVFVGSGRAIERTVLAGTGFQRVELPVQSSMQRPIRFMAGLAASFQKARRLIDELNPEAVIGLGGFASVPLAIAAMRYRVPLILLEQNVIPGRATSWLSRRAERVCVSFEETRRLLPVHAQLVVTGNPLRRSLTQRSWQQGRTAYRRPSQPADDQPSLLILGGSQGAAGVNRMAIEAVAALRTHFAGWRILHQTGERDAAGVRAAYEQMGVTAIVAPYFTDLPGHYLQTTLVISRAGATTLAELACVGLPAVLIPYPASVRDHQRHNAEYYAASGAAKMVHEGAAERLTAVLMELMNRPEQLDQMSRAMKRLARPDAAAAVVDLLGVRPAGKAAA